MIRNDKLECITIAAIAALVLLAVLPAGVAAADTLFTDDFESGNLDKWTVNDDVTVITGGTYAPSWGGYYAQFSGSSDTSDEEITVTINAECYENISVSFARRTVSLDSESEDFELQYDDDTSDTTFTELENYYGDLAWSTVSVDLPASADNNPAFRIRFDLDEDASSGEYAFLDNVTVTGDPIEGCTPCQSQTWYLSNTATTGGRIMYRGGYVSWSDVTINEDSCVIWIANESAETNVAFPAGTWGLRTQRSSSMADRPYNASIGVRDGSTFTAYGNISGSNFPESWDTLDIAATAFTVPQDDYLALRICSTGTESYQDIVLDCSGSPASYVTSPCSDPGYPNPPAVSPLNVTKTVNSTGPYYPGMDITYNIKVCNDGSQTLVNVTVNDTKLGPDQNLGTLSPDNCSWSGEFTYEVTLDDACTGWVNNTVNVSATNQSETETFYAEASANVPDIRYNASINVTKFAEGEAPYYPGQNITYNITVCNNGDVNVTNPTVNDPYLTGGIDITIFYGTLEPGDCKWVRTNYTVKDADACPGWINNTVNASATDYCGDTIYNETSENVTVNCTDPVPGTVDLYFLIDGSGSVESGNFTLQLDGIAGPITNASIVPRDGSISVCVIQFSGTAVTEVPLTPVTNETVDQLNASIRAIAYMDGYTNTGAAFYEAIAQFPCCPAAKQVIDLSTDGAPNRPSGVDAFAYTMTARNASLAAGFDVVNVLGVGNISTHEAFLQSLVYPQPWNDTEGFYDYAANFSVFHWAMEQKIIKELGEPQINVTKTVVSPGPYYTGDNITYNITVCNIGKLTVTNVTVNDPLLGLTDFVLVGTLAPNNCTSMPLQNYTVKEYDVCMAWINNTVNVSADYDTQTIYNETFANVIVSYDSALNVTKVAVTNGGSYYPGDNITYNITVCNIGKLTVTNVTVNDPKLGIENESFGTLAPGNCSSKEFNYTITRGDCGWINNTVEVSGKDYCGNMLAANASWNVTVVCENCISGYKLNESGVGLANWTINVKNSTGEIVAKATTDATGYWQVCGLEPGNYTVCEELQPGWQIHGSGSDCLEITFEAENRSGLNFTNCECNGSISDFVWLDTNQNGIQDPGELGLEGVTVNLYMHASDGTLIGTKETDGTGFYIFEKLCAGNYSLEFIPPPGYVFSPKNAGNTDEDSDVDPGTRRTDVFTLGDGVVDTTIDAGLYYAPEEVPGFTPGGLIALIGLLSIIATSTLVRKRRI